MVEWRERIVADPQICHGRPCIKGTRIMVTVVLDNLATGMSIERLLAAYPSLRARYPSGDCLRGIARRRTRRAIAGLEQSPLPVFVFLVGPL